jgi:cation diffusion facilitator CzcD-associated flavoprotein CzcO
LAEKKFSEIKILEQRAKVGGLWNYSPASDKAPDRDRIPQTSPHAELDKPFWSHGPADSDGNHSDKEIPIYMSPVYDHLETNIPARELMGFSDLDWPENCQLFPRHETVLEYLEHYARDVMDLINFQTQVFDVKPTKDGKWRVTTQQHSSKQLSTAPQESIFGAVVIASGHFSVSFVPQIAGIEAFNQTHPGSILHSKFYRRAESYADKKVIVVGEQS